MLAVIIYLSDFFLSFVYIIKYRSMEEFYNIQSINILMSSNTLQEIKISLFDEQDNQIISTTAKSFDNEKIKINKVIESFYCTLQNEAENISDHFFYKIKQSQQHSIQLKKVFAQYSIHMIIEIAHKIPRQSIHSFIFQNQHQIEEFSKKHLNKIERNIMKKMQFQELKRPILRKMKNIKSTIVRKPKTLLAMTTILSNMKVTKKYQTHGIDDFSNIGSLFESRKNLRQSHDSLIINSKKNFSFKRQSNHCKTTIARQSSMKQTEVIVDIKIKQENVNKQDEYEGFFSLFKNKQNRNIKKHSNRKTYDQQLIQQTLRSLQKQSNIIKVASSIRTMSSLNGTPRKFDKNKIKKQNILDHPYNKTLSKVIFNKIK